MAKTTCKLCSRRFASPRALAGHMRAHSIAAAKAQISSASSASTSIVAGGGDDDGDAKKLVQGYVLREKPKRRVRLAESDFSDRESETTSFLPSSPGAKHGGHYAGSGDAEPVSSVSDGNTPEEDVALSLMMLSRDSWPSPPPYYRAVIDFNDESDARPIAVAAQKRTRFECPACKKAFRSYQALGGHRASNVRGGKGGCCAPPFPLISTPPPSPMQAPLLPAYGGVEEAAKLQPHQCPHCFRVFSSGQALGGHRRSHFCSAAGAGAGATDATGGADPPVAMKSLGFFDLNLPASGDDVELSAVSDPFLSSKPGC